MKKTGHKRLIFGGLHTEICLGFAVVQAPKNGYEGMLVVDAVGGRSQVADRTATERLAHAGAVPKTTLSVLTEPLPRLGVAGGRQGPATVTYWYFAEVSRLTVNVGVTEVEKQAAKAKEYA